MEGEADLSSPTPSWVVIEPGIFCKDLASYRGNGVVFYFGSGEKDASAVEVSAEAHASNDELVRVSLDLRAPPAMSRLSVHLAKPRRMYSFDSVVAAQRNTVLLSLEIDFKGIADSVSYAIDYFICRASPSGPSLSLLPRFYPTQREYDAAPDDSWMKSRHLRMRDAASIGLLLTGPQGFVVAQLNNYPPNVDHDADAPLAAEIFRFRSDSGEWEAKIATARGGKAKMGAISFWLSHQVLPFTSYLCWMDYHRGIILCDVNHENPDLQYISLPVDPVPRSCAEDWWTACPRASRTVCVTNYDNKMKFVSVVRSDGVLCGASKPGTSFSIAIWTLWQGYDEMEWVKESVIESDEIWAMEGYNNQPLPHIAPQFPLLSMENPHIIHFVLRERDCFDDKTMIWFVTVDIVGKKVLSYKDIKAINSGEPAEETYSVFFNTPFFPIEFPKYLKKPSSSNIIEAYAKSCLQPKRLV
uniref:DUF1618 domain-containing protein n=1 Tax=Oryza meridionalis TaxID=40149 RepID=A0A0E0F321_9ORYZ